MSFTAANHTTDKRVTIYGSFAEKNRPFARLGSIFFSETMHLCTTHDVTIYSQNCHGDFFLEK